MIAEEKRYTALRVYGQDEVRPVLSRTDRKAAEWIASVCDKERSFCCTAEGERQRAVTSKGKILVADEGPVCDAGNETVLALAGNPGHTAVDFHTLELNVRHMTVRDLAGNGGGITAPGLQRSAVQALGRNLHLGDAAVRENADLLRTGLSAVVRTMGQTVIENVPFPADVLNAAMVGAG